MKLCFLFLFPKSKWILKIAKDLSGNVLKMTIAALLKGTSHSGQGQLILRPQLKIRKSWNKSNHNYIKSVSIM